MKQTAFVCVVVIALGVATGCIATKETYVSRGNKLYDAGKYADASLNYQKALQKDPNFGEACYRLGLSAIKENQPREAYDMLYRAVQLLPNRTDVAEKFADISLGYYLEIPDHPQFLYKQLTQLEGELLAKNPNSYKGLVLKGYLAQTDRKPKEAIDSFLKARQIDSSDAGVQGALVQAYMQDGQFQEGEKLATDLIYRQKTPYRKIYELMYAVYFDKNRLGDAENVLKANVNNNPGRAEGFVQLARHYYRIKKPDEMKAALQRLLNDPKDFPDAPLWVGDFYMNLREYPEAISYYQKGVRENSDVKKKSAYQDKVLVALLSQGKNEEGLKLADQILKEYPQDDKALGLRADVLLDSGKAGDVEPALHIYEQLLKRKPDDATLRLHLGRAYRKKGDLESARRELQVATNLRSGFVEAKYELGLINLTRGQAKEALQQANDILAVRPDFRPAKLLRTESLIRTGDVKTARTELSRLTKDSATDHQVQFQMALIAIVEKKYPEALDILNRLRSTGDAQVFVGLASIYTSRREFDKAYEVLNEGLKSSADSFTLHSELALTAVRAGQYDRAITEFNTILTADPKSVETMRAMGDVYELKSSQNEAIEMYRKAYNMAPNDVPSALALAGALAQAGRSGEARTLYLGIAKAHPEDATVLNNTAYLLADMGGDLDEALRMAKSALEKSPQQPAYVDTIGYVYLKQGQKDSAMKTFDTLVRKYPHFAAFRYHLGLTYFEKGDKASARRELQTALTDHPSRQTERQINELLKKLS